MRLKRRLIWRVLVCSLILSSIMSGRVLRRAHFPTKTTSSPWETVLPKEVATGPRILVFMTTHLNELHLDFLKKCWPSATRRLPLFANAHLLFYTSAINVPNTTLEALSFATIQIEHYKEVDGRKRKQAGAKRALVDAVQKSWFHGYDWVLRLNPDVLVRDDTWISQQLKKPEIGAILVNCSDAKDPQCLHTDFFIVRPQMIDQTALEKHSSHRYAENHLYASLQSYLDFEHGVAWLPHVQRRGTAARVLGQWAPVIHEHSFVKHCPDYWNATDGKWY